MRGKNYLMKLLTFKLLRVLDFIKVDVQAHYGTQKLNNMNSVRRINVDIIEIGACIKKSIPTLNLKMLK